jgi:hypothetical protein
LVPAVVSDAPHEGQNLLLCSLAAPHRAHTIMSVSSDPRASPLFSGRASAIGLALGPLEEAARAPNAEGGRFGL